MKECDESALSIDDLVKQFSDLAKKRGVAVLDLDNGRANALFDRMKSIDQELRTRGRGARLALAPLLDDPDRFVQFYVAECLLALVPIRSKYEVDSISADARGTLRELDAGTYKPD
jgi:hypothetical protein